MCYNTTGGKEYNLGQYNGFDLGAPHATATASVPAFARGGRSATSRERTVFYKTLQVFDLSASVNEIYKSE